MKKFKNTSEIEPYDGIIGQQRAEKAMQFGLKMNNPAYIRFRKLWKWKNYLYDKGDRISAN